MFQPFENRPDALTVSTWWYQVDRYPKLAIVKNPQFLFDKSAKFYLKALAKRQHSKIMEHADKIENTP